MKFFFLYFKIKLFKITHEPFVICNKLQYSSKEHQLVYWLKLQFFLYFFIFILHFGLQLFSLIKIFISFNFDFFNLKVSNY